MWQYLLRKQASLPHTVRDGFPGFVVKYAVNFPLAGRLRPADIRATGWQTYQTILSSPLDINEVILQHYLLIHAPYSSLKLHCLPVPCPARRSFESFNMNKHAVLALFLCLATVQARLFHDGECAKSIVSMLSVPHASYSCLCHQPSVE
jgi:hypothetical protein